MSQLEVKEARTREFSARPSARTEKGQVNAHQRAVNRPSQLLTIPPASIRGIQHVCMSLRIEGVKRAAPHLPLSSC